MEQQPKKARIIAFYLPQFHPISENDTWWGKGFTEWTNVGNAKPLFKGHYQPRVPADLGYYDLRMPEVREAQARMAKDAGVFGFCYWHYWFGNGKRLLEKPFCEVLKTGKPDLPFCLGWANESWESKVWNSKDSKNNIILIEQQYPGEKDIELHFYSFLNAFKDNRYIKVDQKPLFFIYKPYNYKKISEFIVKWNILAKANNIERGFYFVAHTSNFNHYKDLINKGFDAITVNPVNRVLNHHYYSKSKIRNIYNKIQRKIFTFSRFEYKDVVDLFVDKKEDSFEEVIPTILPNWDHSPRSGKNACIFHNSTPELFEKNVKDALDCLTNKKDEHKIVFLKSWNEWGEGNYIEPDTKYKHGYLNVIKNLISK